MKKNQPFVQGGFQRGSGIEPQDGRFIVPRNGIYNFMANLHVRHRSIRSQTNLKSGGGFGDTLRAMICINSMCQRSA